MSISLTKPLEACVKSKVKTGMYASTSEVIRAELRALVDQELEKNIQKSINEANQGLGKELNNSFSRKSRTTNTSEPDKIIKVTFLCENINIDTSKNKTTINVQKDMFFVHLQSKY